MKTSAGTQKGGSLLVILFSLSIMIVLMTMGMGTLNSMFRSYFRERNKDEISRTMDSVLAVFSDQRFCNAFFNGGYDGQSNGVVDIDGFDFSSVPDLHKNWLKSRLSHLRPVGSRYKADKVTLSQKKDVVAGTPSQGQFPLKFRSFEVELSLTEEDGMVAQGELRKFFGKTGVYSDDVSERLYLYLGNRGECYLRSGVADNDSTGLTVNALKDSCNALAGEYIDGRCYIKQYDLSLLGGSEIGLPDNTKDPKPYQSTLTDSLCEMEKNLVRKVNFSQLSQNHSAVNKSLFSYPTLCPAAPEWSGCIDNKKSGAKVLSNANAQQIEEEMNQDQVSDYMREQAAETLRMRFYQNNVGFSKAMKSLNFSFDNDLDFGLAAAAWALGGPIAFFIQLFMDCDGARVTQLRTCRNGFVEVDGFDVEWEETDFFSCDWEGPKRYTVPSNPSGTSAKTDPLQASLDNIKALAKDKNYEGAIIKVDLLLKDDPNSLVAQKMKAAILYNQAVTLGGDTAAALSALAESLNWYKKVLAINSADEEALRMIKQIEQKTWELNNPQGAALTGVAALLKKNDFVGANSLVDSVIKDNPNSIEALNVKSVVLFKEAEQLTNDTSLARAKLEESLGYAKRVLTIDSTNQRALDTVKLIENKK